MIRFRFSTPLLVVCSVLFTVFAAAQPVVSSLAPLTGPVGTTVTLTGSGFSATPSANIVYFGAVRATVSGAPTTTLTVNAPAGATYQSPSVTVSGLTGWASKPFSVTFPGAPTLSPTSLAPKTSLDVGLHPNGVAEADFDGDGRTDLATPNNFSTTGQPASVSIARNTSTSGIDFAPRVDINTGVLTYAIAAGDLDGDGRPDLLSTSIVDKTLSLFRNTSIPGTISFAAKIDLPTGDNPFGIAVGDLDGDGRADVAVACYLSNSVSVYRNTSTPGTVSFAARIDYQTALGPRSVAIGDLNGDGKPDLVTANEFSNNVSVFQNNSGVGSLAFASKVDVVVGSKPFDAAIGDLDGDGKAEIAAVNQGSFTFSVLRNLSAGVALAFAPKIDYGTGADPSGIAIGDLNGDGKPDITVASINSSLHQNLSTAGTISFNGPHFLFLSPTPFKIGVADLDNDGRPDLAGANFSQSTVSLLRNKANEPTISQVSPFSPLAAGATMTIQGTNFTGATAVRIGGVNATSYTVNSASSITAVVPVTVSGTVEVSNPYGTGGFDGFVYAGPPTVTSFTPTAGGTGTVVTITGTNFPGATSVTFGGMPVGGFSITSPTTIEATICCGSTGAVAVTNPYGTGSQGGFTYYPMPSITSFTPTAAASGATVTITGTDLGAASAVSFGGVAASSFTIVSPTSITAIVGTGATGDLSVTTPGGIALKPGFVILPTVTSFTPATAATGTTVTITGTNFTAATTVRFGGVNASSFVVVSSTTITAVVGAGASGSVSIFNSGGSASLAGFTYLPPPTITSISPGIGGTGTVVTITGMNLGGASAVSFGGVQAMNITVLSPTQVTAVVGAGASGQVSVTAPGGSVTGASFRFSPIPLITSFAPAAGPVGTTVTVTGANFNPTATANTAYVGGVKATITAATANTITLQVPVGAAYGALTITTGALTAASDRPFNTTFPGGGAFTASSFAGRTALAVGETPISVLAADLDADGKPDLIGVNNASHTISIFRNTTSGGALSFAARVDIPAGNRPHDVRAADMDGDGRLDLVCLNSNPVDNGDESGITVLRNTTTGTTISFAPRVFVPSGFNPTDLVLADLDLDGKPDISVPIGNEGNFGRHNVMVFRNLTTGSVINFFQAQYFGIADWSGGNFLYPSALSGADFNRDGLTDLVAGFSLSTFTTFLRNETPAQSPLFSFAQVGGPGGIGGGSFQHISVADFNADGYPDFLTDDYIFRNTGANGGFTFAGTRVINHLEKACVADLDGDGQPDFVRVNHEMASVGVARNTTATPAAIAFATQVQYATGNAPADVFATDLDGDGRPEIITADRNDRTLSILKNTIGSGAVSACVNGSAMLIAAAAGTTYQWQVNDGSGFINLSNSATVSGATSSTLTLQNIPATWNNEQFRCVVDGTPGPATTLAVTAPVAPTVTIIAESSTICEASPARFSAITTNGGTNPVYQWQVNGVNVATNPGVNGSLLTIFAPVNNDAVKVTLTSNAGCITTPTATSNIITLNITPGFRATGSITAGSQCTGQPIPFTFHAINTPVNSSVVLMEIFNSNSFGVISPAQTYTGAPLVFTATTPGAASKYYFRITPPASVTCGLVSSSDTTTIAPAALGVPLVNAAATTLTVTNPDAAASYSWQVQGAGNAWATVAGATGISFTATLNGTYRAMATRGACTQVSTAQTVVVTALPTVGPAPAGSRLYPNPSSGLVRIDTLRLSDHWETLEVRSSAGGQCLVVKGIRNQTQVVLNLGTLPGGSYDLILRRRDGSAGMFRVVKR
ncbi:MAG: cell surface receptor domain protein [Flaviaesturariibacter sp.]|nr:cell surface receptor domain protein [Flaviaesturariibacter sp.]